MAVPVRSQPTTRVTGRRLRPEENPDSTRDKVRDAIGIGLTFCGLFLFIALATHNARDWGQRSFPGPAGIVNKGGSLGAWISYNLFVALGVCSYILAFFFVFWGALLFLRRPVRVLAIKIVAVGLLVFSSSAVVAQQGGEGFASSALAASMPSPGGVYGETLARVLVANFGSIGSYLVSLLIVSLSLLLSTDWLLVTGATSAWRFSLRAGSVVRGVSARLYERLTRNKRHKKAVANSRVPGAGAIPAATCAPAAKPGSAPGTDTLAQAASFVTASSTAPVSIAPPPAPVVEDEPRADEDRRTAVASDFELPDLELLEVAEPVVQPNEEREIQDRMGIIEETLRNFEVGSRVVAYEKGPVLTKYELELDAGIRVHKVIGMADDLAIALKAPSVRIIAPIPGKSTIGLEVPNAFKNTVKLRELIESNADEWDRQMLPLCLGKDAAGVPIIRDLADMPHLLIAGTTGSGKSVCLNAIILSLLYARSPEEMKLILIDPKMVELSAFKDIPHLISPVITEMKKAAVILEWLVRHMEERYDLFSRVGVKKIESYNALGAKRIRERLTEEGEEPPTVAERLPHIVVVIDELADLMMVASKEVENAITRISQKSRAVGIHLVVATQRPSVDVITGLIKSNMPVRIAFKVASKVDSRTILDRNGADKLLGKGDMLLLLPGTTDILRAQCTLVTDKEVKDVVGFLRSLASPQFEAELMDIGDDIDIGASEKDDLFDEAVRIVIETQRGSVSLLQRKLEIGYGRAARLIDIMAKVGVVGEYKGSKAREVLLTIEEWDARRAAQEGQQDGS
ncbi:MAG: DNA translocase FtsK [Planctomycetota bacterium]|nr:DNA translocase FtsK [Planctomycetota bacterium]